MRSSIQAQPPPAGDRDHAEAPALWNGAAEHRPIFSARGTWHRMMRIVGSLTIRAITMWCLAAAPARAQDGQIERGKYLVTIGGCNDCHTPGTLLGKPDTTKLLSGSEVGLGVPGLGVFVGRNLTPDKETGLGTWTRQQIVTAITTGERPDGRILAPIMPWRFYSKLTREDSEAIAAYLQSLTPVNHLVPGPFGPSEKLSIFVMEVLPADVHNNLLAAPANPTTTAK